jgi:hypothetical protein
LRVQGSGFEIFGLRFRVKKLDPTASMIIRALAHCLGFRVQGLGFRGLKPGLKPRMKG